MLSAAEGVGEQQQSERCQEPFVFSDDETDTDDDETKRERERDAARAARFRGDEMGVLVMQEVLRTPQMQKMLHCCMKLLNF